MKKRLMKVVGICFSVSVIFGFALMPFVMVGCGNRNPWELSTEFISVRLTEEASVSALYTGKEFTPEHFPEFSFSGVMQFEYRPGQVGLQLRLSEPSEENAEQAVKAMEGRPDIESAWRLPVVPNLLPPRDYTLYIIVASGAVLALLLPITALMIYKKRRKSL